MYVRSFRSGGGVLTASVGFHQLIVKATAAWRLGTGGNYNTKMWRTLLDFVSLCLNLIYIGFIWRILSSAYIMFPYCYTRASKSSIRETQTAWEFLPGPLRRKKLLLTASVFSQLTRWTRRLRLHTVYSYLTGIDAICCMFQLTRRKCQNQPCR